MNNSHFELERSTDGRDFQAIEKIDGKGISHTETNYHYTDIHPLAGMNYYRLKQVDFSGQYDYSKTIAVRMEDSNRIGFYPTNTHANGTLKYDTDQEGPISIKIVDFLGRKIKSQEFYATVGVNLFAIDTEELLTGSYLLLVEGEKNELTTLRFSKIN